MNTINKPILGGFLAAVLMLGCISKNTPPDMPHNVPSDAIWIGGNDGGVFLKCVKHENSPQTYSCKIYNDSTGEIEVDTEFAIAQPGDPNIDINDRNLFDSWDGDCIYLKDGRRLERIKSNK